MSEHHHTLRSSHLLDHLTLRDVLDGTGSAIGDNQDGTTSEEVVAIPHEGNSQESLNSQGENSTLNGNIDLAVNESSVGVADINGLISDFNKLSTTAESDFKVNNTESSPESSQDIVGSGNTDLGEETLSENLLELNGNLEVPVSDLVVVESDQSRTTVNVPTSVPIEQNHIQESLQGNTSSVNLHSDNTERAITNQLIMTDTNVEKQRLVTLQESVQEDIFDYIGENPAEDILCIDDVTTCITKIEELRSKYRSIHKDIRAYDVTEYDATMKEAYEETLKDVKAFITDVKKVKNSIRSKEVGLVEDEMKVKEASLAAETERKKKTKEFLLSDMDRLVKGVSSEININMISADRNLVSDEALISKRTNLPSIQKRIDTLAQKYLELLNVVPDLKDSSDESLSKFILNYEKLQVTMIKYQGKLQEEIKSRELDKEKNFKASKLEIKLPKFKGYDSELDIYTFQDKYDKLHSATTPKRMMAEHIKNNYLEGSAADFVKRLDDIDEIWKDLKRAFGDPRVMLTKKLSELDSIGSLERVHNAEKIKDALSKLINVIHDLMKIADAHKLEDKLYNDDSIYSIYKIMGNTKVTRFIELEKTYEVELVGKELWKKLLLFLEKDIKIQIEKAMIFRTFDKEKSGERRDKTSHYTKDNNSSKDNNNSGAGSGAGNNIDAGNIEQLQYKSKKDQKTCFLCDKDDHVATKGPYGKKLIQYFSCQVFAQMSPGQRFEELKKKGLCHQCLFPGAKITTGKHVDGTCQSTYKCKHESHNTFTSKKHVLVCEEHKNDNSNKQLLEEYRTRCITRNCNTNLPNFAKEIQLSFHCVYTSNPLPSPGEFDHDAIYMFQRIHINGETFLLFFDNGCGEIVMTNNAVQRLKGNAKQVYQGSVKLGGVGGVGVESPYGAYEISLPLANGRNAVMSGLVIEQITNDFPNYVLDTDVQRDIVSEFVKREGNVNDLPKLQKRIGGQVDIMIGVKYLRYFPKEVFMLLSGLTMYCSPFVSADGSRGVVAGPHKLFSKTNNHFYAHNENSRHKSFFTHEAELSRDSKLEEMLSSCCLAKKSINAFNETENAGSEITYRCVECRKCPDCKKGEKIEMISTKEEVEQVAIEKSVKVDFQTKSTTAFLPFMEDPVKTLAPNKSKALMVYKSQVKKLNNDPPSKADVIAAEAQLQQLGFVDYVRNLTDEQRRKLFQSALRYFIPWRAVWNANSISTPCRPVFDASMPTSTGKSLNQIIAKGKNTMNKLVEIMIRFFIRKVGMHCDIKKMYNTVKLDESHWCYQLYLWHADLHPEEDPEEKVIKTAIYGLTSSGNQAEYAIREIARLHKEQYPRVYEIIHNDIYVDDCLSGEETLEEAHQSADEIDSSLNGGGFKIKGFTFSGSPPASNLSNDGKTIKILGIVWDPEQDLLSLDIDELNFSKKQRGKKSNSEEAKKIPPILTHSICLSKVSEIFDIVGLITPLTAAMKIDLHELVVRKITLKDKIPDELRPVWESHFEMMKELKTLHYKRCIVPEDAVSLDIETIDTGDASKSIACVAIYARLKRRNGEYSCQLVFSRSKLVPDDTTNPRGELFGMTINAHTGEVVKRSFGKYHTSAIKLGDNQIALHSGGDR